VNFENSRIDLNVTSKLYHDTHITAQDEAPEDTIFNITASLNYVRPSKTMNFEASAGVVHVMYFDNSDFDDTNAFFDISLNPEADVRTSRFTFSGDLLLNTDTSTNEDVGGIVTTRNYAVNGQVFYDPNERLDVILNASASRIDPDESELNKLDRISVGLTLQTPVMKQANASLGATYSKIKPDSQIQEESETMAYFLGLNGIILTKLQGSVSAGIQNRKTESNDKSDTPYVLAELNWLYDESTSYSLAASSSFNSTINSYDTESSELSLSLRRQLNPLWTLTGSVGYSKTDYESPALPDRSDDEWFADLQLSRSILQWGSLGLDLRYSDRESDQAAFTYSRFIGGVSFTGTW
jgi:hypothetical protein